MKTIKSSLFGNTYGGLDLLEDDKGNKFLKMQDCFGPDIFGPLTEDQIIAFYTLCGAPAVNIGSEVWKKACR